MIHGRGTKGLPHIILWSSFLIMGGHPAGGGPPELFVRVPQDPAAGLHSFARDPAVTLSLSHAAEPATVRRDSRWTLPLDLDRNAVFRVDRIRISSGVTEARGHLEGIAGSEVLVTFCEDSAAGIIRLPASPPVHIVPAGDRLHRLLPPSNAPAPAVRCANELLPVSWPVRMGQPAALVNRHTLAAPGAPGSIAFLDLAILYTAAAEEGAGGPAGMRALLALALVETNDAFSQSQAPVQVRAACQFKTEYVESGDLGRDLERLKQTHDGFIDEVHAIREQYAADIVCLIVDSEQSHQYAGLANQLWDLSPDSLEDGFFVCVRPYLIGNYSLPHEIGHLLGCSHDRENAGGAGLEPWSYGTRITVDDTLYRTVMAYRPGLQIPYFSNPGVTYHGVPCGVPDLADNVRTMTRTAATVAAVREAAGRVAFETAELEVREDTVVAVIGWTQPPSTGRFRIRTVSGSAREGIDYIGVNRAIDLAANARWGSVEVQLIDNAIADGPRHFALELSDPSAGLALGPVNCVTVTILDDEEDLSSPLDSSFRTRPGADYLVTALAPAPDGGLFVGGGFASIDQIPHSRVARLLPDGRPDPSFTAAAKYRVHAMTPLSDGRLAIAGDFNLVNGELLNHLAVLRSSGALDPQFRFEAGTDQVIHAIVAHPDGRLTIGGAFTSVQRSPASRIARILPDGSMDPSFDSRAGPDDDVLALARDHEGKVVAGGRFKHVGPVACEGIARFTETGELDPEFTPPWGVEGAIHAVALDGEGRIIAGGDMTRFNTQPVGNLVRLTPSGEIDEEFQIGTGADGPVLAMVWGSDEALWIAGGFTHVDGHRRNRVARLHADGALDLSFDPGAGPDDWVLAIAPRSADSIAIGGLFRRVNGVPRGGIAALLTVPVHPPRFTWHAQAPDGIHWRASVLPGQTYEIQQTSDFRSWEVRDVIVAPGHEAYSTWPGPLDGASAGFLRIRRRIE